MFGQYSATIRPIKLSLILLLTRTDEMRSLNIEAFIFENPYLGIHPDSGGVVLSSLAKIIGYCVPAFVMPQEMDGDFVARNKEVRKQMEDDPQCTSGAKAGTCKAFLEQAEFFRENMNNWPKDFQVSLQ